MRSETSGVKLNKSNSSGSTGPIKRVLFSLYIEDLSFLVNKDVLWFISLIFYFQNIVKRDG
jgi:hypothetical protein